MLQMPIRMGGRRICWCFPPQIPNPEIENRHHEQAFLNIYALGTESNGVIQGVNDGDLVDQVGLSRKHVMNAIDASIQSLDTCIDVLQTQRMDSEAPKEETMKVLSDVVESGKAIYIGGSTVGGSLTFSLTLTDVS